jgi:UDP-N-acetylglucosamine:LPS N-acetylglucosamine transferase
MFPVLQRAGAGPSRPGGLTMRVLCIASGGGHIDEMLECLDAFKGHEIVLAHYKWPSFRDFTDPRISRRGGGMRLLFGTALGVFQWLWLLLTFRPQVIFSTGAELAIVPFWLGRILFRARCIYLETGVRQTSPTRTGPLVYPVCNVLFVQSEALLKHYGPKARYAGRLQ